VRLDNRSRTLVAVTAIALALGAAIFWANPGKAGKRAANFAEGETQAPPVTPALMLPASTEVTHRDDPRPEPVPPTPTPEPAASTNQPKELTCPALEPATGSACSTSNDVGLRCAYQRRSAEVLCVCEPSVASNWVCKTVEEDPPVVPCPLDQPASDSGCGAPDQLCVYGVGEAAQACQCKREALRWSCIASQTWRGEK
jgi:hypothetical protein